MPPRSTRDFRVAEAPVLTTFRAREALEVVAANVGLLSGNVWIHGRRTSLRLEPMVWESLQSIAASEDLDVHAVVTSIAATKHANASLSSAVRIFVAAYYATSSR